MQQLWGVFVCGGTILASWYIRQYILVSLGPYMFKRLLRCVCVCVCHDVAPCCSHAESVFMCAADLCVWCCGGSCWKQCWSSLGECQGSSAAATPPPSSQCSSPGRCAAWSSSQPLPFICTHHSEGLCELRWQYARWRVHFTLTSGSFGVQILAVQESNPAVVVILSCSFLHKLYFVIILIH